jgi:hypothetical protein
MQGQMDLFSNTENAPSVAPQSLAQNATVHGAAVDVKDRESVVLETHIGSVTGAPTGGNVTAIMEEAPDNGGSPGAFSQVNGSDQVVGQFNDTLPEILRYRYIGGANGKQRWVRMSITNNRTGGTTPAALVAGNVLKGGLRFAGKQPTPGAAPQTPGTPISN